MKNLSNGIIEGSDPLVFTPRTPEEIEDLVRLVQRQAIRINSLEHTNTLLACQVIDLEETISDLTLPWNEETISNGSHKVF